MKLNRVEDVFVKIKCTISNMIQKLQQEAAAQLKDWCDKETAEPIAKRDNEKALFDKLSSKLDTASAEYVIVYKKDTTLGQTKESDAQMQVLDIPTIGFVRCGRSACRIAKLKWKMGKETGGMKMDDPHCLKSNEMAQCSLQSQQPLVCDSFKNYESLSRVCFMDGSGCVMKLNSVEDVFIKIKCMIGNMSEGVRE